MNLRGELSPLVQIIIAIIVVALFIVPVGKLWAASQVLTPGQQELQIAEAALDRVLERVKVVPEGRSFELRGVPSSDVGTVWSKEWYLVGWSFGEDRPDVCLESCLCVCKPATSDPAKVVRDEFLDSCQKTGFCQDVDFDQVEVVTKQRKMIKDIVSGETRDTGKMVVTRYGVASLDRGLNEFVVVKKGNSLELAYLRDVPSIEVDDSGLDVLSGGQTGP